MKDPSHSIFYIRPNRADGDLRIQPGSFIEPNPLLLQLGIQGVLELIGL